MFTFPLFSLIPCLDLPLCWLSRNLNERHISLPIHIVSILSHKCIMILILSIFLSHFVLEKNAYLHWNLCTLKWHFSSPPFYKISTPFVLLHIVKCHLKTLLDSFPRKYMYVLTYKLDRCMQRIPESNL